MFVASKDVMHLCSTVVTLPSAVATRSAVVAGLRAEEGGNLVECVRSEAPKMERQTGPLLEARQGGVAAAGSAVQVLRDGAPATIIAAVPKNGSSPPSRVKS